MTHWGPTYYEMTHKETAEELEQKLKSQRRAEAFPNVGLKPEQDHTRMEWALRRKKDGKIVVRLDGQNEPYEFGPMGHCPEGYEVVTRTLWPTAWERTRF